MPSLHTLASRKRPPGPPLPPHLSDIVTPFKLDSWAMELRAYPDEQFKHFILSGIEHGFRIRFDYANHKVAAKGINMSSAFEHPQVIDDYIAAEKSQSQVGVMPKGSPMAKVCHVSPCGVVPKKAKPGKWRLIIDLSTPNDHSVNDGIEKTCVASLVSVDQVVDCILCFEQGALLEKVDIKQAYRNVPVHPDDRLLLGMRWKQDLLIDKVLPFGLRSAPIIFSAIANALQWVIQQKDVDHLFHYLDDFITIGPPSSEACQHTLSIITSTCQHLGVPV